MPGDERDGVAVAGDVLTFALVATCAADAATGAVSCGDCASSSCTLADNFNWTRWTQRYAAPAMAAAAADDGDEAAAAARAGALARGAAPFDAAAISIVLGDAASGYANCTGVRFNRTSDDPSAGALRCTLAEDSVPLGEGVAAPATARFAGVGFAKITGNNALVIRPSVTGVYAAEHAGSGGGGAAAARRGSTAGGLKLLVRGRGFGVAPGQTALTFTYDDEDDDPETHATSACEDVEARASRARARAPVSLLLDGGRLFLKPRAPRSLACLRARAGAQLDGAHVRHARGRAREGRRASEGRVA